MNLVHGLFWVITSRLDVARPKAAPIRRPQSEWLTQDLRLLTWDYVQNRINQTL
jgi:hypothetical protein